MADPIGYKDIASKLVTIINEEFIRDRGLSEEAQRTVLGGLLPLAHEATRALNNDPAQDHAAERQAYLAILTSKALEGELSSEGPILTYTRAAGLPSLHLAAVDMAVKIGAVWAGIGEEARGNVLLTQFVKYVALTHFDFSQKTYGNPTMRQSVEDTINLVRDEYGFSEVAGPSI